MTAPMVDYKIHWLKMMSVPKSRAVVGRHDGINGRDTLHLFIPARLKRTGRLIRFNGAENELRTVPDHSLHRLLAQAHQYRAMVMHSGDKTMRDLAAEVGVTSSYFGRVLRLSFLAPKIVSCILNDRHAIGLTAKRLANEVRLPAGWDDQHGLILCDRTNGRTGAPIGRPSAPG